MENNDISHWFDDAEYAILETDDDRKEKILRITPDNIFVAKGFTLRVKPFPEN